MKKMLMMAAVCLMAAMAFADAGTDTNKTETIVLNAGNLRPGGNTPVFKAGDFQTAEKMDLADITRVEIGNTLVDNGDFDFSKATSGVVSLQVPWAWSAGGKSEALRVTSLMVDPKTKIIRGAESTSLYFSLAEGIHAITNDIWKAVRAKKFARFNKPEIDMQKGTGHVEHFWPVNGGQQWIELKTQFVMAKNGMMSVNSLLHVMGDQINTKPMCQK